jgi:hypothetical protein
LSPRSIAHGEIDVPRRATILRVVKADPDRSGRDLASEALVGAGGSGEDDDPRGLRLFHGASSPRLHLRFLDFSSGRGSW